MPSVLHSIADTLVGSYYPQAKTPTFMDCYETVFCWSTRYVVEVWAPGFLGSIGEAIAETKCPARVMWHVKVSQWIRPFRRYENSSRLSSSGRKWITLSKHSSSSRSLDRRLCLMTKKNKRIISPVHNYLAREDYSVLVLKFYSSSSIIMKYTKQQVTTAVVFRYPPEATLFLPLRKVK